MNGNNLKSNNYENLKLSFKKGISSKVSNTINCIKNNIIKINSLSKKEQKIEVIKKFKEFIIKDFGYTNKDVSDMFTNKYNLDEISSKDLYRLLLILKEIKSIDNLNPSHNLDHLDREEAKLCVMKENDFKDNLTKRDAELLSNILPFLEKNLDNHLFNIIYSKVEFRCTGGDCEDYYFNNLHNPNIEINDLSKSIDEYLKNIDSKYLVYLNDFKNKIISEYGKDDKLKGYKVFIEGVRILSNIDANKEVIKNFIDSVKSYLKEKGKNKVYLNGRDGLKLKIILEKYLGSEIEIIRFEMSMEIYTNHKNNENIKENDLIKYINRRGLNKDNIEEYIGIDTGNQGRTIGIINSLFSKEEKNNMFLWGTGEGIDGFKHEYDLIEKLPKSLKRANTIVKGNIIQLPNGKEEKLLSDFSDIILEHILG